MRPPPSAHPGQYPLKRFQNDYQFVYDVSAQIRRNAHAEILARMSAAASSTTGCRTYNRSNWSILLGWRQQRLPELCGRHRADLSAGVWAPGEWLSEHRRPTSTRARFDWRVARTLTLNLGARFGHVGGRREVNHLVNLGFILPTITSSRVSDLLTPRTGAQACSGCSVADRESPVLCAAASACSTGVCLNRSLLPGQRRRAATTRRTARR